MSQYYNAPRTRGLYVKGSSEPFKLSRSKLELSIECPRCFYLDRRLGIGRPPGFPFNLNSAVDTLLKCEFDTHRACGTKHPLQEHYCIDAIPVQHNDLNVWRDNFTGIQAHHAATNFIVFGAIDDLWQDSDGAYIVVDYKATSKAEKIESLDKEWQNSYKRQMEIYQWLLRQNGYTVSNTGYFVYCNGKADLEAFDAKLEFDVTLIPYTGDDTWVENAAMNAKKILESDSLPQASGTCDFCTFFDARKKVEEGNASVTPPQKTLL